MTITEESMRQHIADGMTMAEIGAKYSIDTKWAWKRATEICLIGASKKVDRESVRELFNGGLNNGEISKEFLKRGIKISGHAIAIICRGMGLYRKKTESSPSNKEHLAWAFKARAEEKKIIHEARFASSMWGNWL